MCEFAHGRKRHKLIKHLQFPGNADKPGVLIKAPDCIFPSQKLILSLMKNLFLPASLIICLSCAQQKQLSEAEVTKEVIALTHTYNQVWETLDMDSASWYHDDSIRYYWHGFLAASSNEEFRQVFGEWLAPVQVWKMEIENLDVQVLSNDLAIVGFNTFSTTNLLASGEDYDYGNGALTYVWKRSEGEWKIVHIHESALEAQGQQRKAADTGGSSKKAMPLGAFRFISN